MLLDTHVWVWAAAGESRIGPRTRRLLDKEAAAGRVCVSAISAFEISALCSAGRLVLNQPAERWIRESIEKGNLRVLDLDTDVAMDAGAIGATVVPDPIDRLLDSAGRTRLVRVHDASR